MENEKMVRKQIYIEPEQNKKVKKLSAVNGKSEAEVIRDAIDFYLTTNQIEQKDPLLELIGLVKDGETNGSTSHDQGIYLSKRGDNRETK